MAAAVTTGSSDDDIAVIEEETTDNQSPARNRPISRDDVEEAEETDATARPHSNNTPTPKSKIWTYFTTTNQNTAACNLCRKSIKRNRGNTSNMWSHLQNNHISAYLDIKPVVKSKSKTGSGNSNNAPASGTIIAAFQRSIPYAKESSEFKERTKAVAKYICGDGRPLSTVESPFFRDMVSSFDGNNRYTLPSRRDFGEKYIPQLYLEVRQKVLAELKDAQHAKMSMFSLTTDLWTSCTKEPYMSLTIHFHKEHQLRCLTLATTYVPDRHTGINLAAHLESLLQKWELSKDDITSITTDSAANMVKMGRELELRRLPCFGHLLHNAVMNGCKDPSIQETANSCRKIVAYFHYNNARKLRLGVELSKSGKPQLEIKAECTTRWGSMYDMMSRLSENMVEIRRVLVDDSAHLILGAETERVIQSVVSALQPFKSLTDALSGEKEVTSSLVLPMLGIIKELVEGKDLNADEERAKEIREAIMDYLDSRLLTNLEAINLFMKATLLDPRFKISKPGVVSDEQFVRCRLELNEELLTIIKQRPEFSTDADHEPVMPKQSKLGSLYETTTVGRQRELQTERNAEEHAEDEFRRFKCLPTVGFDSDPLEWWKIQQPGLPSLYLMAKRYLSIQGSSSASERLFSKAGFVVSDRRSCLTPTNVEMLNFLAMNLSKF